MLKTSAFCIGTAFGISGAQNLTPTLLSTAGGSDSAANFDLEWSVVEPVIGPFDSTASTTFGYQQLDEQSPSPILSARAGLSRLLLKRSPGLVKIVFDQTRIGYEVSLFNSQGRDLRNFSVAKGQKELSFSTEKFGNGTIFMNVYTQDKKLVQGFKLIGGER